MARCRNSFECIVPNYLIEQLLASGKLSQDKAFSSIAIGNTIRENRSNNAAMVRSLATPAVAAGSNRAIYSADNSMTLRKRLVRSEGSPSSGNFAADKVYDFFGKTYDFYKSVFDRNSVDGAGMKMVGTVELGPNYNNAFWNGSEMGFGNGDGITFKNFVDSIDVIGHELTHGVVEFNGSGGLNYDGQSGALNESMADVFGMLVKQFATGTTAAAADWLIGSEIMVSASCLRSMKDPHAGLGTTPNGTPGQPKHMSEYDHTSADHHGVHINSGIPNHAFYKFATKLGGFSWDTAGRIWYDTLTKGNLGSGIPGEQFQGFADKTMQFTGSDTSVRQALRESWAEVGITVTGGPVIIPGGDNAQLKAKLEDIRIQLATIIGGL